MQFLNDQCQEKRKIDYNSQIKPIINDKCISCHGVSSSDKSEDAQNPTAV